MEQNRRNKYTNISYIDGTAARKIQPVRRPEEDPFRRNVTTVQPKRRPKQKRKPAINLFGFLVLAASMGLTLYTAVDYLVVQSQNVVLEKKVSSLQAQLTSLTNDNNASLNHINTTLDLEKVFHTAVEDLGMVFPNKNQIITYKSAVSEYVRQYDKVPELDAKDLLEKFRK